MAIAEPVNLLGRHDAHADVCQQVRHLQPTLCQPARDGLEARARVRRAQRMIPVLGPRHDGIGAACDCDDHDPTNSSLACTLIFKDGFESGSTSAWSHTTP